MLIIPAIDLRGGRCVRLTQGDFARETTYDDDPVRVAERWRELGASWVHVVDLDGARAGEPRQLEIVTRIARIGVPVELGGGLRSMEHLEAAFAAGVTRVVLGTAAIENPALLEHAVRRWGAERVVLGVDARRGRVAVRGWAAVSDEAATTVVNRACQAGVEQVIYTDIDRDGTLTAPNYEETRAIAACGVTVIASGGVSRRSDLERLAAIPGVIGAIVGRALYTGDLEIGGVADWCVPTPGAGKGAGGGDELAK